MSDMTKQVEDAIAQFTETAALFAEVAAAVPGYVMDYFRALGEAAAELEKETAAAQSLGMSLLEYRIRREYPGLLDEVKQDGRKHTKN